MSTSITLRDLMALMRDAVKNDTALNTFCVDTLGSALTLQVGTNPGQPLGKSNSPYCILVPTGKALGETVQFAWEVDVSFGLDDDTFSDYQSNGVTEMRGQYRLEELGDLIIAAINNIDNSYNYQITAQRTQLNSEPFPLHVGLHTLTLTTLNVIGGTLGLN